jgi:hypothetical protein
MPGILKGWFGLRKASPALRYIIIAAVLAAILIFQLGTHPSGLSQSEVSARVSSQDLSTILDHPINAPHNLLTYAISAAGASGVLSLRLSSVLFGLLFLCSFYALCKAWFGKTIGLMGAVIMAATPFFLILARQASAEVMFFSIISIMAAYLWLLRTKSAYTLAFIALVICCALFIYTPGVIWWLAGAALVSRKKLFDAMSEIPKTVIISTLLLGVLLVVPLAVSIVKDIDILKSIALVPGHLRTPLEIVKSTGWMAIALLAKAPYRHNLILGQLPLLNFVQVAFLFFGIYAMWSAARGKALALAAGVVFGIVAAGINDNLSLLAFSVASLLVFVVAGLRYLYIEWRSVFPRNPLAKSVALALMCGVVVAHLLFGLRYSLVAWPQAESTKTVYVLK